VFKKVLAKSAPEFIISLKARRRSRTHFEMGLASCPCFNFTGNAWNNKHNAFIGERKP
jgi:hypothetical protein